MRRIVSWLSLQKVVLFLIIGVVIYQSRLTGSQWLLGWDSLVPELDWKLNFSRALAGAWQEYQGLGLTGGMAHLADLSRMVILWLLHFAVSTQYLRWVWHMGMLALGPIGIWYLGKRLWKWSESACLVASVFYLLNLATVQYFFVPYEAFSSFYGFLPWLIAVFLTYLESGSIRDLKKIVWVGILATSAFYVQTLFVVYVMVLVVLSLGYLKNWRRILAGFLTIFAVNAFWLLPIIYGVINGGGQVGLAKINSIGSPETALMNGAFGNWQNVITLKGYWLEYIEWVGGGEWGRLMQLWWRWSGQRSVELTGWTLFGVSIVGSLIAILKRKMRLVWLGGLLLAYIMVGSFNLPFGFIYQLLVEKIPLFGEMFRSVFTKWSVVLALFVGVGLGSLAANFKNKWISGLMAILVVAGCGGIVWPVFRDGMIFGKMKVELPKEYVKMFAFMKAQPKDGRVAYIPGQDIWSWKYTDWGYRGSGFLWYGIEQPILDRAFDVWSPYNEGFYDEFSSALYGCDGSTLGSDPVSPPEADRLNISADGRDLLSGSDPGEPGCKEQVARVLEKYDVRYVLLDESVIAPGQDKEILRIEETKKLAEALGWEQKFQEGFLTVWSIPECTPISKCTPMYTNGGQGFVSAPGSYTYVDADTSKVREDVVYEEQGTYAERQHVSTSARLHEGTMTYPFAQLMREETANVEYGDVGIRITNNELRIGEGQELEIPGWKQGEWVEMGYSVQLTASGLQLEWEPIYTVNGQEGPRLQSITNNELHITNGAWVQVGENKAVYVKQNEVVQGSAKLQVGEPIHIKVFDGVGKIEKVIVGDEQQCGDYRCWATPLPKAESDSLVQTITHYEGQVSPEICLDKEGDPYACTNELRQGQSPVVVTTAVHKGERYWLDWVAKDAGTTLKEPGVVVYGLDDQWTMDDGQWETFLQNSKFQITNSRLELEVPGTARVYDFGTLGKSAITNCDVLKRGRADKLQMSTNKQMYTNVGQETGYTADERGAACDYAEMSQLDTRLPYLMRVVGQNVAGRSLKFFLWNTGSKRNDIEALTRQHVSTSARFDQTFSLFPWEFAGSYTLNTETRSFGQYAENRLAPVEMRYVPLEQLAKSKIQSTKSQTDDVGKIQNSLQITYTKKVGTWLYRVGVRFECTQIPNKQMCTNEQPGLIRLSQGFDNGWVGVLVNSNSEFRIQKLEHAKVDGWANGWMIPSARQHDDTSARTVILFYWPQLLEYIGFVALGFTLIFLLKKSR